MPYVDGETLRQKLDREKQLGVDEALRIASAVADALDYAHRQGVLEGSWDLVIFTRTATAGSSASTWTW